MNDRNLDDIIAEYLIAVESGEQPERERLMADNPHFADQLRRFFADYDRMASVVEQHPQAYEPDLRQLSRDNRERLLAGQRQVPLRVLT